MCQWTVSGDFNQNQTRTLHRWPTEIMKGANQTTNISSDEEFINVIHIVASTLNCIIFIVGTIGNGMVIWLAGFKIEKTVCSIWYLNLAVADFFFCAFRMLNVVREAMLGHWPFGVPLCKLNSFVKYLNLFSSVLLLVVINLDRYIMVAHPIWCRIHRNIQRAVIVCFIIWLLATALSLPYIFFFDSYPKLKEEAKCICEYGIDWKENTAQALRSVRLIVGFVIPFIIIISCNCILFVQLKKKKLKTSRSSLKLIAALVIAFFVCWLPHHVLVLLKHIHGSSVKWKAGFKIANFLAFFSFCVNPVLYFFLGILNKQPRKHSLISTLGRVFMEDSSANEPESQVMQSVA